MFNFEEEVAKFTPSREIDKLEESLLDSKEPDITDLLDSLIKERRGQ